MSNSSLSFSLWYKHGLMDSHFLEFTINCHYHGGSSNASKATTTTKVNVRLSLDDFHRLHWRDNFINTGLHVRYSSQLQVRVEVIPVKTRTYFYWIRVHLLINRNGFSSYHTKRGVAHCEVRTSMWCGHTSYCCLWYTRQIIHPKQTDRTQSRKDGID